MSKKFYDEYGHEKYEVTTGQSAKAYQNGEIVGTVNDKGQVISNSGTVIDNLGSDWRK